MSAISSNNDSTPVDPDRVMPLIAWCNRCGFSEATGRRLIKTGQGPVVTWLSERRMGIRERHHREWLDSRIQARTA
jgi:predicted DNA-binding transcriptional regulator AlpA